MRTPPRTATGRPCNIVRPRVGPRDIAGHNASQCKPAPVHGQSRMSDANHSSGDRLVLGALALELTPGSAVGRDRLDQVGAGTLGERIATDLARFQAEASLLELSLVGAHYDPVELLRRGWPLHRE